MQQSSTFCCALLESAQHDSMTASSGTPCALPYPLFAARSWSAQSCTAAAASALPVARKSRLLSCSVEMFLLPDGSIFLNEVAPRPHNSGHYTQNGCVSSQFENHVRAVLGWPLGDTSLNCGCCIMLNLLGEADGDEGVRLAHEKMATAYMTPGASVHW